MREWLGGESEQRECLKYAVNHNNADLLNYLLETVKIGGRVSDRDSAQLLHTAAKNGNERIIFELAGDEPGYGADVNATDADGNTSLHIAAANNQPSAVRFLLSLGAQLDLQNNQGETPLHASVRAQNLRSTKDLLLRGASRKVTNRQGETAGELTSLIHDPELHSSFNKALASPWYYGCPMGRLPMMPIKRDNCASIAFLVLFFYIVITQIVVLQPGK